MRDGATSTEDSGRSLADTASGPLQLFPSLFQKGTSQGEALLSAMLLGTWDLGKDHSSIHLVMNLFN